MTIFKLWTFAVKFIFVVVLMGIDGHSHLYGFIDLGNMSVRSDQNRSQCGLPMADFLLLKRFLNKKK